MAMARRWYFTKRPKHDIEADTMQLRTEPLPALKDGEFMLRTMYLSLDATLRLWISEWDLYIDPVKLGDPMKGFIVGEVMESRNKDFPVGSLAAGLGTWSDYIVTDGIGYSVMPRLPGVAIGEAFGVLGIAGPSAYVGLHEIGRPKPGDTVVVTAAAGAVGVVVGQLAKIHGCRTIGIAGGAEKCRWLKEEVGYDEVIDYKAGNLVENLRKAAPDGIDIHYENVGGEVLDAGLTCMKDFGTVVVCGLISTYNDGAEKSPGPYMFRNVIMRRLRIEGFVVLDYVDKYAGYQQKLAGWMMEGKLKFRLHVVDGIDNALDALKLLYTSGNHGKLMVRIGADPK